MDMLRIWHYCAFLLCGSLTFIYMYTIYTYYVHSMQASMRQVGAGLGASGSSHGLYNSAGTYRETLRHLTKSRYDSVFQE